MQIKVPHLLQATTIHLTGAEPWLASIYSLFAKGSEPVPALSGWLKCEPEVGGTVRVTGSLSFMPAIGCGRCDRLIPWDLSTEFNVQYRRESTEPRDRDLQSEELDIYFIENDSLDLEMLVNEQVQLMVPSVALRRDPAGKTCMICGIDVSSPLVAQTRGAEAFGNPFAKLQQLRSPGSH